MSHQLPQTNRPAAGDATPAATRDPVRNLLARLADPRRDGAGWRAPCPACGAGLTLKSGPDGQALLRCDQACPPEQVAAAVGLAPGELYADVQARPSGVWRATGQQTDPDPARQAEGAPEPERDMPAPEFHGPPPLPFQTPEHDAVLLPFVYALTEPYIAAGQAHGPLPPIRSEAWYDAPPEVQLATLLVLGMAWLVAEPHQVIRSVLRQASNDVHGGDGEFWRRHAANHMPYEVLKARRAQAGTGAA